MIMVEYAPIEERVLAGAMFLDLVGPSDWRDRVDSGELFMAHADRCVLGQVFAEDAAAQDEWETWTRNGFRYAEYRFGWHHYYGNEPHPAVALGFMANNGFEWDELERLWRVALAA